MKQGGPTKATARPPRKLSDTQLWIMRELKKPGGRAHLLRPEGNAFISNKTLSAKSVRAASLFALQDAGMIEDVEPESLRWRGSTYKLTGEGKKALREYDRAQKKGRAPARRDEHSHRARV